MATNKLKKKRKKGQRSWSNKKKKNYFKKNKFKFQSFNKKKNINWELEILKHFRQIKI